MGSIRVILSEVDPAIYVTFREGVERPTSHGGGYGFLTTLEWVGRRRRISIQTKKS